MDAIKLAKGETVDVMDGRPLTLRREDGALVRYAGGLPDGYHVDDYLGDDGYLGPDVDGVEPEWRALACACDHCDATAEDGTGWGRSDDGEWYCAACLDYGTDDDGTVICATHGEDGHAPGAPCSACGQDVEWGPIQTGGAGAPNYQEGTCGCEGRSWGMHERGHKWTVPAYTDATGVRS